MDAKTGAVEGVWSSAPYDREKTVTEADALKQAEAFLRAWCPDRDLVLYPSGSDAASWRTDVQPYWRFTFAQEASGLPFRGNAVHVGIDAADGSVYSLSSSWDEDVTFDDAGGVVSMEAALAAWAGTYETVLAYRSVPLAELPEQAMEHPYALRLTYGLERQERYEGVDAKTGAPVREERADAQRPLTYTDLAGSAARADIEALARYGAGFAGGRSGPAGT